MHNGLTVLQLGRVAVERVGSPVRPREFSLSGDSLAPSLLGWDSIGPSRTDPTLPGASPAWIAHFAVHLIGISTEDAIKRPAEGVWGAKYTSAMAPAPNQRRGLDVPTSCSNVARPSLVLVRSTPSYMLDSSGDGSP